MLLIRLYMPSNLPFSQRFPLSKSFNGIWDIAVFAKKKSVKNTWAYHQPKHLQVIQVSSRVFFNTQSWRLRIISKNHNWRSQRIAATIFLSLFKKNTYPCIFNYCFSSLCLFCVFVYMWEFSGEHFVLFSWEYILVVACSWGGNDDQLEGYHLVMQSFAYFVPWKSKPTIK